MKEKVKISEAVFKETGGEETKKVENESSASSDSSEEQYHQSHAQQQIEPKEPPNYRPSATDVRGIHYKKECFSCKFIRQYPLTFTCVRYLAHVYSDHVCDDWEDGRNKWGFTNLEPSEEELALLRIASPLLNLQRLESFQRRSPGNTTMKGES